MSQFKLNKDVASSSAVAMEDMLPLKSYLKNLAHMMYPHME